MADEPVLRGRDLALSLNAPRWFPVNRRVVRAAADLTYGRTSTRPAGWLDLGFGVPVMDTTRRGRNSGGARFTRPATSWWNCWTASATTPGHLGGTAPTDGPGDLPHGDVNPEVAPQSGRGSR